MNKRQYKLQSLLMPNPEFGSSENMYVRKVNTIYEKKKLKVSCGGRLFFDTFYNSLSTVLWKEKCGLNKIYFAASGKGKVLIKLVLVAEGEIRFLLSESLVRLQKDEKRIFTIDMSKLSPAQRGLIYLEMFTTQTGFELYSGTWYTDDTPRQTVKIGVTITHFNRKEFVLPAAKRIKTEIIENPEYNDKIYFTIIDNSQNITPNEVIGVNLIPNKNTGGSGGFMRGLIHYKDNTDATHVLFMDDDASCEIESVKRAYAILSYAQEDNTAIAGALLKNTTPDILIEKGARFTNICTGACRGWNMCQVGSLVGAETQIHLLNYGAWWFFAFPISHVKYFSFPFFVRGDDILFSLLNKFNIITAIGIACYAEDFSTKVSPLTWYLDTRGHMVNTLITQPNAAPSIYIYIKFFLDCLFSYRYGSLTAARLGLSHTLGDLKFWHENYDLSKVRSEIEKIQPEEKMREIDLSSIDIVFPQYHESRFRTWIRKLTLNGLLLPYKKGTVYQEHCYKACLRAIFRYKKIIYYKREKGIGYIATASKTKFIKMLFLLAKDCLTLALNFKRKKAEYLKELPHLTSESFWKKALKLEPIRENDIKNQS